MAVVRQAVRFPITVLVLTVALLTGVFMAYGKYGAGVEFFPNVEPDYGLLYVHARGNLSLAEMDMATRAAEDRHARLAGHQVGLYARRQDARRRPGHPGRRGRRHPVRVRRLARTQVGATRYSTICASPWPAFPVSMSRCACRRPGRRPARRSRSEFPLPIPTGLDKKAKAVATRSGQGRRGH